MCCTYIGHTAALLCGMLCVKYVGNVATDYAGGGFSKQESAALANEYGRMGTPLWGVWLPLLL